MNTIVWLLMISHSGNWIPSIEFKDEKKCLTAAQEIKNTIDGNKLSFVNSGLVKPKCVRIEK